MRADRRFAAAGRYGRRRFTGQHKRRLALCLKRAHGSGNLIARQAAMRVSDFAGILGRDRLTCTRGHALHLVADRSKKIRKLVILAAAPP